MQGYKITLLGNVKPIAQIDTRNPRHFFTFEYARAMAYENKKKVTPAKVLNSIRAGLAFIGVMAVMLSAFNIGMTRTLCANLDRYTAYEQAAMSLDAETCGHWLVR